MKFRAAAKGRTPFRLAAAALLLSLALAPQIATADAVGYPETRDRLSGLSDQACDLADGQLSRLPHLGYRDRYDENAVGSLPVPGSSARDAMISANKARTTALRAKYGPRIGSRVKNIDGRVYGLKPSSGDGRRWFRMNRPTRTVGGIHGHHGFPQQFRDEFREILKIDIDDYIYDVDSVFHLGRIHPGRGGGPYNRYWADFFAGKKGPITPENALGRLEQLRRRNFVVE